MTRTPTLAVVAVSVIFLASTAVAEYVDINTDPVERLVGIAHINDEPALQLIAGRPWPSVRSLTGINGIGRGRIRDILEQNLACVGVVNPTPTACARALRAAEHLRNNFQELRQATKPMAA